MTHVFPHALHLKRGYFRLCAITLFSSRFPYKAQRLFGHVWSRIEMYSFIVRKITHYKKSREECLVGLIEHHAIWLCCKLPRVLLGHHHSHHHRGEMWVSGMDNRTHICAHSIKYLTAVKKIVSIYCGGNWTSVYHSFVIIFYIVY